MAAGHRPSGDVTDDSDPSRSDGAAGRDAVATLADLTDRLRVWVRWIGPGRLLASAGAVAVVAALGWWMLRSPAPPTEARLPSAADVTTSLVSTSLGAPGSSDAGGAPAPAAPTTSTTVPENLVVHVAGAVVAPGVFELPLGSRVADAVRAAGGPAGGADPNALNLAALLVDGDRVAVPLEGETIPAGGAVGPAGDGGDAATGPVNVNTANAAALEGLPGVGPATAQAIVAHREANGPFASVDDLENVRGIGPAKLEALRGSVTV